MNIETGAIMSLESIRQMPASEQSKYIEVKRDLTKREEQLRQINRYTPCGCGSGKKFKFCCFIKRT